ncbi:Fibronectin type III domain-containing protein [Micromonospora pattaloongensis]|uniref:Fibronectin type III domain-containing protein n=1 Tax=Micromonospora pattaloongensis TaxID=405436 RepID=A0A1H3R880_9ACTN|nr:fibronectin type III domain-containing protein [Micromonospora pattaloongensis]SDZ21994.1 Fibronectin type III domain-containing protein [Micromonospora pattaloongensis]
MVTTGNGTTSSDTTSTPKRRLRTRGGLVTAGTVVALVAAMGLTVLGLGAADNAVASYDASSWLWSAARSEMARVNGVTGRVDTRMEVPQARSHPMQVTQTDRFLILRDLSTGRVSSLDLATLQITATTMTTAGLGVSVAMHEDAAFVVDAVQGIVRQLDPRTLVPVGEPVRYPPGITGGFFDGAGRLWIAVPSEGTVSAITAAPLSSSAAPSPAGGGGLSPKLIRTVAVAPPSNDLAISALDNGVAVLNRTSNALVIVRGEQQREVPLSLRAPGALPPHTSGAQVPVTVPDAREIVVVGDSGVQKFGVPGAGNRLRAAVAWAGRFYVADDATGKVYAFDATGKLIDTVEVKGAGGLLELEVRENHLFINAPNSSTARVVDAKHTVRVVDKYANDILGGDPPPAPPPPPPPKKPVVGKPSAPRSVSASAGNAQVRVSWDAAASNGAPIIKYVVEGAGKTREVGANQRSLEITGLTNGKPYRFSVHAVNAKGAGPARMSNPVVPTAEVPDPPASVTAQARPDGTVVVKWPAANGQGRKIRKYAVTATSAGASAPVGESPKTQLVIPTGELEYGTQYAFSVIAVNEKGAGSKASPISNSVVPFTLPDAPQGLEATTVAGERGTILVSWAPAQDNGRPITKYVVEANGRRSEVSDGTRTKLTGFGDGESVTVKVQAVNEAGAGQAATDTAQTVARPQVTITGSSSDETSVTVNFTVNDGGGQAQCRATVPGATAASGSCSRLTVGGLKPSSSYTVTVTASNAAGEATAKTTRSTVAVYGRAVCNNNTSSSDPAQHTWCDNPNNGREIRSGTSEQAGRLGRAGQNDRLEAICKVTGSNISHYVYNKGKADPTNIWIRVPWGGGTGYISFAWFNLEGYGINSTGPLPTC